MKFDIAGARDAGYSDQEIAEYLSQQQELDLSGAIQSGYSYGEALPHLQGQPQGNQDNVDVPRPDDAGDWNIGHSLRTAASNVPESFGRLVGNVYDAAASPLQTLRGIGDVADGYEVKLMNQLVDWGMPESWRDSYLNRIISNPEEKEAKADAMNQFWIDRYGSKEAMLKTFETDPVGMLADAAALFTGAGGALRGGAKVASLGGRVGNVGRVLSSAGEAAANAGLALDPLNIAAKVPGTALRATGIPQRFDNARRAFAEKRYLNTLKPPPGNFTQGERSAFAQTGLREHILPNEAGLDKLDRLNFDLAGQGDRAIEARAVLEDVGAAPRIIDPEAIGRGAFGISYNHHGSHVNPGGDIWDINNSIAEFIDSHGVSPLNVRDAQKMKVTTQRVLDDAYGEPRSARMDTQKNLVHGLRKEIESAVPEVAPLNHRMAELKRLRNQIVEAITGGGNKNSLGLHSRVANGAGAYLGGLVGGPPGAAAGAAITDLGVSALWNPVTQARIAMLANDLNLGRLSENAARAGIPAAQYGRLYEAAGIPAPSPLSVRDMIEGVRGLLAPEWWGDK